MSQYEDLKFNEPLRKRKGKYIQCETCQRTFYVNPARIRQAKKNGTLIRFCSNACYDKNGHKNPFYGKEHSPETKFIWAINGTRHKFRSGKDNPAYKDGRNTWKNKGKKLINKFKCCMICGFDKKIGILQIHHIDRNRLNNSEENLQVLCPNCHLTDHFLKKDGLFAVGNFKR